jgi:hypothetical protein
MKSWRLKQVERAGEVTEASTTGFVAQCYELYKTPPLGALVRAGEQPVYGIVMGAETTSIEPGRRPIARGKDEQSEEDIYRRSPQLKRLLRTEFSVIASGYRQDGRLYRRLPPQPVPVHAFVYPCSKEEVKEFAASFDFLPLLINGNNLAVDAGELTAAALREMSRSQDDPHAFLVSAGKELAGLLWQDYVRLKTILGRLQ